MTRVGRRGAKARGSRLLLLDKPFGVLSQFGGGASPDRRDTLAGWIDCPGVFPAGRLDKDSEGLLLLSDDGPTRAVEVDRIGTPGLWPRHPPVRFRGSVPDCWLRLTLQEGRNRQVRRMTAAIGYPTRRLVRWRIGPWTLDGLSPGDCRSIPARNARAELMRTATIELSIDLADKGAS